MVTLRAVELFCASGGMAEGFRRAGIDFEWSVDIDTNACESYEYNLGRQPLQIDVRHLLGWTELLGAEPGRLDLVVADPPCTPWSRAGKRLGLSDPRDQMGTTARLLALWRPRVWLIGNVPGADDGPHIGALQRTIGALADSYCIDYASLDAAAYGVPQHRVRTFWFGHPLGTPCLRWPASTHGSVAHQTQIEGTELRPYVTVRDALQHLPVRTLGKRIRTVLAEGRGDHRPSRAERPARTLTRNPSSDGALLLNPKHPINRPDKPSFTITTKGDIRGAQGACVSEWPWSRPSTVVTTRAAVSTFGRSGRRGEPQSFNAIKLSERAGAILQGFPEDWYFAGKTKRARWSLIGQAMPPPLAEAVARSIAQWWASNAPEQRRERESA